MTRATNPDEDERRELLGRCTEAGRLSRADRARKEVTFHLDEAGLYIAAVGAYHVVLDTEAQRIQHGCRDFLGQASEGRICKHVAALLMELDVTVALCVLQGLTRPVDSWHLEAMSSRGFQRS